MLLLNGRILRFVFYFVFPLVAHGAYLLEMPLFIIAVFNALTCFVVAAKSIFLNSSNKAELNSQQLKLLGLEGEGELNQG